MRLHEVIEFPLGTVIPDLPSDNAPYRMYRLSIDLAARQHTDPKTTDNRPVIIAMTDPEEELVRKVMSKDSVASNKIKKSPSVIHTSPVAGIAKQDQTKINKEDISPVSTQAQSLHDDWRSRN